MKTSILRFRRSDAGVSAIEYALLGGLIAVVIIVSLSKVSTQLVAMFTYVKSHVLQATS